MNYFFPRALGIVALLCLMVCGCATTSITIPPDLSPMELIQRAQEASDRNRYGVALQYYEALLERFPNDIYYVCAAEYEIAFIHYKQQKYAQARTEFQALLARYEDPAARNLPPQFRLLAVKVLEQIDEKEKSRRLFSR